MSVGWRRQYETEAVAEFYEYVRAFAAEKPKDARLQAFARKCKLTALMVATQEQKDIERGDIAGDRAADCDECRRWNRKDPCEAGKCIYQQPTERLRVIRHYFGDEGTHFLEWAGGIIKMREAQTCTR